MTFEYSIKEHDYLDFQLYAASQSERIQKKKRNGHLFISIGSLAFALLFYWKGKLAMSIYMGLVAVAAGIFFPKYFNWRYKKHYASFIKAEYAKRFGLLGTIEVSEEGVHAQDKTGEVKVKRSEIIQAVETERHFFVEISTGISLIIPKRDIENPDDLKEKFRALEIIVKDQRDWSWD